MTTPAAVGKRRGRPSDPTAAELEALRTYLAVGSVELAALRLGRRPSTVANHLASLRRRLGVETTAQAVAALGLRL